MSPTSATAWACLFACASGAACTADVGDLFGPSSLGGSSQGGSEAGGSPSDDGNGGTTSSRISNGAMTGGSTNATTGATTDATQNGSTQESVTTGPPPGPAVDCGGSTCSVEGDGVCCFDLTSGSTECIDASACDTGFTNELVAIGCQAPEDCDGGLTCCARREAPTGQSHYDRTECARQCAYPDLHLCDITAPDCPIYDTFQGPVQSVCQQSQLLPPGYFVCGLNN